MLDLLRNPELWMISNRQPWVYALTQGFISTKTRSMNVHLPPEGATIFLHASKAIWRHWRDLPWCQDIDVHGLPRGGVVAVARLVQTGWTDDIMPPEDEDFFQCQHNDNQGTYRWNCAAEKSMRFADVTPIPFIACRGAQIPTRQLPEPLTAWIQEQRITK